MLQLTHQAPESSCGPNGTPGIKSAVSASICFISIVVCFFSLVSSSSPSVWYVSLSCFPIFCLALVLTRWKKLSFLEKQCEPSVSMCLSFGCCWPQTSQAVLCCNFPGQSFPAFRSKQHNWVSEDPEVSVSFHWRLFFPSCSWCYPSRSARKEECAFDSNPIII